MLLNTGEDDAQSGAKYGLLGAVKTLITNVFLPTVETQVGSWNADQLQNGSIKTELVNSLSSLVHAITSQSRQAAHQNSC